MKFRAKVLLNGKTATGIRVPPNVVAGLGSSKRPAVRATIKGHTYRSTVAPMGGEFMLPISAEIREITGVKAGDDVEVSLALDTEPREVTVPPDLKSALAKDAGARTFFEGISYSNKLRIVLSVDGAKSAETRERRIAKAVESLREGRP
jgi:Bacteriocin-protection, YdeI or OmpD-Associated/Domain of unknown function (DUF1905)